jgi:hypothetical protein
MRAQTTTGICVNGADIGISFTSNTQTNIQGIIIGRLKVCFEMGMHRLSGAVLEGQLDKQSRMFIVALALTTKSCAAPTHLVQ